MVVVHERSEKVAAMFEGAMDAPAWAVVEWACMACCECEAAVSMAAGCVVSSLEERGVAAVMRKVRLLPWVSLSLLSDGCRVVEGRVSNSNAMVCRHKSRRSRAKARLDSNNATILNASSSSARLRHLAARRSGLVPFQAAPSRRVVRVSRDDRIVESSTMTGQCSVVSPQGNYNNGQIWRTSCHACPDYLSLNKILGTDMQARRGFYGGEMLLW
jgi:hypothetical protein